MGLSTITPETRSEEFIDRIARAMGSGGTSPLDTIVPETRHEEFIDRIARANGWEDTSPMASIYPETRLEEFLNRIADNAGGALETESGFFIPDTDIVQPTIVFQDSHDSVPLLAIIGDVNGDKASNNSVLMSSIVCCYKIFSGLETDNNTAYAISAGIWVSSSSAIGTQTLITSLTGTSLTSLPFWITNSKYTPRLTASTYFRAGRKYEWHAYWL